MAAAKGTTADTMDTNGMMGMDTTAAAGGFRGSLVVVGVIRGTGIQTIGILTPATITIATMTIRMGVTTAATLVVTAIRILAMTMTSMVILGTKVASATMAATGLAVTMDIINHGARIAYV